MQLQVRNHQDIILDVPRALQGNLFHCKLQAKCLSVSRKSGHSRSRRPKRPVGMSCASQAVDRCRDDVQRDQGRDQGPRNTLLFDGTSVLASIPIDYKTRANQNNLGYFVILIISICSFNTPFFSIHQKKAIQPSSSFPYTRTQQHNTREFSPYASASLISPQSHTQVFRNPPLFPL